MINITKSAIKVAGAHQQCAASTASLWSRQSPSAVRAEEESAPICPENRVAAYSCQFASDSGASCTADIVLGKFGEIGVGWFCGVGRDRARPVVGWRDGSANCCTCKIQSISVRVIANSLK